MGPELATVRETDGVSATIALMRAKGADEFRFHARLARHARLGAAVRRLHDESVRL